MVNQQDPRVLRTRQLIKNAFRDLMQSKGFDSITINDIAQSATVNRATFYDHYEDKYALLDEFIEQAFREMIPEQVRNAQEWTREIGDQLILLTYRYIEDFYRNCRMAAKSIATIVDAKIKKMLQMTIEGLLFKGDDLHAADRLHKEILAAMTGSAIYGAAHYWLTVGDRNRTDMLLNMVRPYVMNGLGLETQKI